MRKQSIFLLVMLFVLVFAPEQKTIAQYTIPSKMNWWYEARFGMFIHFGSYSYLGHGEWAFATENWTKTNYQTQVTANFNPVNFNPGQIARLAKKAGMKYLVITAKHHEGFCMWQTAVQSFKDVTGTKLFDLPDFTAFKTRDILKELKDSCDAVGVKFCLYYSILDWDHPSQTMYLQNFSAMASMTARADYINDMKAQLGELITKYHPYIMWFDGDWTYNTGAPTLTSWWTKNDGIALYDTLTKLDPNLLVNERVFRGAGLGDYECPEQTVPLTPLTRPWETNQTMNNSWGYNASDNNYKTPTTLIQQLVQVVSRDGNYLLNIGPKGDGTVTSQSVNILNSFGDWMSLYSGSIYGTTRSPYAKEPAWGYYTKKTGKLFAHVFTWPTNGKMKIPSLTNKINKIYLMKDTTTLLNYADSIGYIWISLPVNAPNSINSVIVFDVSGIPTASTQYVKVTDIAVNSAGGLTNITSNGGTLKLSATVSPANATDKTIRWANSDTTIASINATGLLTSLKNGTVTITAFAMDGSDIQGNIAISVSGQQTKVSEIRVHSVRQIENITMNNDTLQMYAFIIPGNAADKTVKWTVSDTTIASITPNGLLTAKKNGSVTIIATTNDVTGIQGALLITISGQLPNAVQEIRNDNNVYLFPNPVEDGTLNIKQAKVSLLDISIYNISGQLVMSRKMNGKFLALDVSALSPGIYSVKISNGETVTMQKIIRK